MILPMFATGALSVAVALALSLVVEHMPRPPTTAQIAAAQRHLDSACASCPVYDVGPVIPSNTVP
jgi:hypothetical protein